MPQKISIWKKCVGPENLWSGPRSTRAQGLCWWRYLPRTNRERPKCLGAQPRMTLSSVFQDFKGKSNISLKAAPKEPPEEEASRMRPTWGYGGELVQGKYVPFALNAPTNVLTILMRKDAWTGWLQSSQLTKSKGRQLMGRVLKLAPAWSTSGWLGSTKKGYIMWRLRCHKKRLGKKAKN